MESLQKVDRLAPNSRRRRRTPEDARREILEAAQALFAQRGPDAVGLKDVARQAGVSHALVTHYFGTYDALVEAVLERRVVAMRDRAVELLTSAGPEPDGARLLDALFALVNDPVHVRLTTWAVLSGRGASADFLAARQRGLELVAGLITTQLSVHTGRPADQVRPDVEFVLLLALSAAYGWAIGKPMFLAALGRNPGADEDGEFRKRLNQTLRQYLALGR